MPLSAARRLIITGLSLFAVLALGYFSVFSLSLAKNGTICFCLPFFLLLFVLPALFVWTVWGRWAAVGMLSVAALINLLVLVVTQQKSFLAFFAYYAGFYFLFAWFERRNQNRLLLAESEGERNENEKNEQEVRFAKLSEDLDASFQKYSVYYSLREVAEEFATTLSLEHLARIVVKQLKSFISKAEACLLYLAEVDQMSLSLVHSETLKEGERIKSKTGDVFDLWVLKTRQPLHILDTKKDVRFDSRKMEDASIRSLIVAPLVDEGRVVGMCRAQSSYPNVFTTEDLRLLYALSVLASPAFANALLWQKTHELAIRDSLTGLFVHRYFKDRLKDEHRRALMSNVPLSLLMCDLDYFKKYNDSFGHTAGDMILVKVAQVLASESPEGSIVARYGGEEFAILMPRIAKPDAMQIAEKIRQRVESGEVEIRREMTKITVSIGVSTIPDDTMEREELLLKADQSLYAAKRGGRNRVASVGPGPGK
ncbi:MAG TPA: sensor domain-containing diguanylate cyclase [Candidatus Omnitrophota bacterium]|nr:sensor domain-containing diguanylate cyclase [Candidatus Omnitrophota bacterium]